MGAVNTAFGVKDLKVLANSDPGSMELLGHVPN